MELKWPSAQFVYHNTLMRDILTIFICCNILIFEWKINNLQLNITLKALVCKRVKFNDSIFHKCNLLFYNMLQTKRDGSISVMWSYEVIPTVE
jgi:hypothetical protein